MALDQSAVFRQLDHSGRFGRFSFEDAMPPLIGYSVVFLGSLVAGYSMAYAFVALVSIGVAMFFLRTRFPDSGLYGLLSFIGSPKFLSALKADPFVHPYPRGRPLQEKRQ